MFTDPPRATNPAAQQVLEICRSGRYQAPSGNVVSIERELEGARAGARLYSPAELESLRGSTSSHPPIPTFIEVSDSTTQRAAQTFAAGDA